MRQPEKGRRRSNRSGDRRDDRVAAAPPRYPLWVARARGLGVQYEAWGTQILVIGVLSILLTAPAGAMLIDALGPRWLRKEGAPTMMAGDVV